MALKKFNEISLQKTELLLKTYTGENIAPVGVLKANVEYKGQQPLDLHVVKGNHSVLKGRDWLYKIHVCLDWCANTSLYISQATLTAKDRPETMLDKYLKINLEHSNQLKHS